MTQAQTEEDLNDRLMEESAMMLNHAESTQSYSIETTNRIGYLKTANSLPVNTRCLCQLEIDSPDTSQPNLPRLFELDDLDECLCDSRTGYFVVTASDTT